MNSKPRIRVAGAAAIVMSSIVVSRITGFVREMLVPNMLGVNNVGDAYNMAFLVTGLMYDMLVGGAIAAALIPIMSGYLAKGKEKEGWKAAGTFINLVFIVMSVTCFLGIIFADNVVPFLARGFGGSATELTVRLSRILFPSVAFLMLAGITNGVLNSYHRFAAAAYGPSIYNIGSALSIALLSGYGVETVAYGVMFSSLIYFVIQLCFAFRNLKFYKFKIFFNHPGFRKLFGLAIPSLIASSIVQINVIISAAFTTYYVAGSVTAFNMANRTWQMPYGIFAQGIGIALLPTLSARLAVGEVDSYKETLSRGLNTVLLLAVPSAIGFVVLREPIIRTIFQFSKSFDELAVSATASVLMFFSTALITQSMVTILNRAFYASKDTKTPLFTGTGMIILNFSLNYIFLNYTSFKAEGMALSYAIASAVNAVFLMIFLNKRMNGIYLSRLTTFLLKITPVAVIMGIIVYYTGILLPAGPQTKVVQILQLLVQVIVGAGVYFTIVLLLKVEEAVYIFNIVTNKVKSYVGISS